jgi:hypothetical protein
MAPRSVVYDRQSTKAVSPSTSDTTTTCSAHLALELVDQHLQRISTGVGRQVDSRTKGSTIFRVLELNHNIGNEPFRLFDRF